ncbi:hypothetical protein L228DRAFT_266832 [Xylona heveae TC161]|uniref:Uncharacterized protein n=1 Tax=Xylona heveae (strain CBS 132557 / TC161) TaxID=1328760 RepID=A0A165I7J3_XYLHT|nr:hypothetical protein L228DRAFT_266832 [Xylona heveae TC161]KZF24502.1 hypothetical protein L228DRAFT_266832 [Xylona heveae TC161]
MPGEDSYYKPQTSRQAKRAAKKSTKSISEAERRKLVRAQELHERAERLREKERRRQVNAQKRKEKEQRDRETRKRTGVVDQNASKFPSSQQSLAKFWGPMGAAQKEVDVDDENKENILDAMENLDDQDSACADVEEQSDGETSEEGTSCLLKGDNSSDTAVSKDAEADHNEKHVRGERQPLAEVSAAAVSQTDRPIDKSSQSSDDRSKCGRDTKQQETPHLSDDFIFYDLEDFFVSGTQLQQELAKASPPTPRHQVQRSPSACIEKNASMPPPPVPSTRQPETAIPALISSQDLEFSEEDLQELFSTEKIDSGNSNDSASKRETTTAKESKTEGSNLNTTPQEPKELPKAPSAPSMPVSESQANQATETSSSSLLFYTAEDFEFSSQELRDLLS